MSTKTSKVTVIPKLVTLEKGLKLAESWVKNMSGSMEDEPPEVEIEGRHPRLGLGAKAALQPNVGRSADPVERRLRAKLNAEKKKRDEKTLEKESQPSEKNGKNSEEDDDSDEEPESRTNAFKKRMPLTSPLQGNKKQK